MKFKFSLLLFILFVNTVFSFAGEPSKAPIVKTVIISGKITDFKSNELLAGVKIECPNTEKPFYSDLNGHFFIALQVNSNEEVKLEFSQIGYDSKILDLKELQLNSGNLQVDLQPE